MRGKLSLINLLALVLSVSNVSAESPATTAKPAAPPPSSLTITSKAGLFRVEADHADVQTVIKQLFEKGDRQFNLENGINGIVTIRLIDFLRDFSLLLVSSALLSLSKIFLIATRSFAFKSFLFCFPIVIWFSLK